MTRVLNLVDLYFRYRSLPRRAPAARPRKSAVAPRARPTWSPRAGAAPAPRTPATTGKPRRREPGRPWLPPPQSLLGPGRRAESDTVVLPSLTGGLRCPAVTWQLYCGDRLATQLPPFHSTLLFAMHWQHRRRAGPMQGDKDLLGPVSRAQHADRTATKKGEQ